MSDDQGREWVRERIKQELHRIPWNIADLAREAGVDAGTVGDFLNGARWPQYATRAKIAEALGWTPDSLTLIERGMAPLPSRSVGGQDQDAGVLLSLPPDALEGLTPAEREEVISAAKASLLERARQIRRRVDR